MLDFRRLAIVVVFTFSQALTVAQADAFEAAKKLEANAKKWAGEFITFVQAQYDIELDWSHTSIKYLDDVVDSLHEAYVKEQPTDEEIWLVARALGSYVTEVYRILNGGVWGWVENSEGSFPGVKATSGATFVPFEKVLDRIKSHDDPDIWEYYGIISDY